MEADTGDDVDENVHAILSRHIFGSDTKIIDPFLIDFSIPRILWNDLGEISAKDFEVLKSRKKVDAPRKAYLISVINTAKEYLASMILEYLRHNGSWLLGENKEGVVFSFLGTNYKVTTPEFKRIMKESKENVQSR